MLTHRISSYEPAALDKLVCTIPFFRSVMEDDRWQYDLLISFSKLIEYAPNEVVIEKGSQDSWLYFLLKGQLDVIAGGLKDNFKSVNTITPGETFGDLASLKGTTRNASVISSENSGKSLVLMTDYEVFGRLEDTSKLSLRTKLGYFRNTVHSLRWKLDMYRASYPDKSFASDHRKIKLFTGEKNTMDELKSLYHQAVAFSELLQVWNKEL